MNTNGFEDRLLHELKSVVADNAKGQPVTAMAPHRRFASKRNLSIAGAAGAVAVGGAAAIALPSLLGGAAAYAVEADGEGKVTVEVHELKDPEGLEDALAAEGIPAEVEYLPAERQCSLDMYEPDPEAKTSAGVVTYQMHADHEDLEDYPPDEDADAGGADIEHGDPFTLDVFLDDFEDGDSTLVLTLSGDPEGGPANTTEAVSFGWASHAGVATGEVGECEPEPMEEDPDAGEPAEEGGDAN